MARLSVVGYVKRTYSIPWATRPWITLTLSLDALSVSAFIVPTENNAFSGLFPQIWSPLGSSLLVTNERAFLTVGILENILKRPIVILGMVLSNVFGVELCLYPHKPDRRWFRPELWKFDARGIDVWWVLVVGNWHFCCIQGRGSPLCTRILFILITKHVHQRTST